MPKNLRIRTEIGVDKEVTLDLSQDFDMLEILSLQLHQTDVYPRNCADFGVIAGRVIVNGGFGIPNAKVSVFIPLDKVDAENEVVRSIYPYKNQNNRNEKGYRYNLLSSTANYTGHIPTGSFPEKSEVFHNPDMEYVYNKYYKFTVKTNESGDFMIYGVPVGDHTVIMNVDLSDIGCFSMVPEDFKLQGEPSSSFNGARFKSSTNIDKLPQIVTMSKFIDVRPFWGDEESGCGAAITRTDFDLREMGVEVKPTAVFMGSLGTDQAKMSVNKNCRPRAKMGELCSLVPAPGTIESIRFTPFFKQEEDPDNLGSGVKTIPVLQRFDIDGGHNIDDNGAFLINIPMNLDYVITNEFGERTFSQDPSKGVPTKAKHRFRIKPEETVGSSRQRRRGAFLVPNIKEYNSDINGNYGGVDKDSYAFSIDYWKYPNPSINTGEIIACKDYFYEFSYSKVYTVSQFHNHWKHRRKDGFIGVKEIAPREEKSCDGQANPFPTNSANKNINFNIVLSQFLTRMLQVIYTLIYTIMALVCTIVEFILGFITWIKNVINSALCTMCYWIYWRTGPRDKHCNCGTCPCSKKDEEAKKCKDIFGCMFLRVTKYPECDKCGCFSAANGGGCGECTGWCDELNGAGGGGGDSTAEGNDFLNCASPNDPSMRLEDGCYSIPFMTLAESFAPSGAQWGGSVTPIESIGNWRKRENVFRAMCDGLMNYFWGNNWVGGFLYAFQFKAKLKPNEDYQNGYKVKHCGEVVFFHSDDQEFYYRSTPYSSSSGTFIGDNDSALRSNVRAEGGNERNLHFPTTIMDLGPVIENISEICTEKGYREGCSVSDEIGVTTFSPIGEFMWDAVNEVVNFNEGFTEKVSLRTFFQRDEVGPGRQRELNGGMATIISQLSEVGITDYAPPGEIEVEIFGTQDMVSMLWFTVDTLAWEYMPPGALTKPNGTYTMWEAAWPSTVNPGGGPPTNSIIYGTPWGGAGESFYYKYSVSVPGNSGQSDDSVTLTPLLEKDSGVLQSGSDVRECIVEILDQTSQVVPFYVWDKNGGGYGTNQYTDSEWVTGSGEIAYGNIQDLTTWRATINSSVINLPTTPITASQSSRYIAPGVGYHYYFGLIPGATSYDTFIEKYVPKPMTEEELLLLAGS
tara:strand:+ start:27377 stop:30778 length:3402 start_codon:yes stop_codon:yes gene_type:complete